MDDLELIAATGITDMDVSGYADTHHVGLLGQAVAEIKDTDERLEERKREIASMKALSKEGKAQELATSARTYIENDLDFDALLTSTRDRLDALRARMLEQLPPTSDDAAVATREAEVREWLLAVGDMMETERIWFDAIDRGETLVFRAVADAPRFVRSQLVSDVSLAKGKDLWASKRDADLAREVRDLARMIRAVETLLKAVRTKIAKDGKVPEYYDELMAIAGGPPPPESDDDPVRVAAA